jgi:hypothetical protein
MKLTNLSTLILSSIVLVSCQTAGTVASGTANTVGNAAHGVGRTATTAGRGVANTVGNTVTTAGEGIGERDLGKATVGTAAAAGKGTANTAVNTGSSHLKTTRGVVKDVGKTAVDVAE